MISIGADDLAKCSPLTGGKISAADDDGGYHLKFQT